MSDYLDLHQLATAISEQRGVSTDYMDEMERYIVSDRDEDGFLEVCAQLRESGKANYSRIGRWVGMRLLMQYPESDFDDEENSGPMHATLLAWCDRIGVSYGVMTRWIRAARNRELVPELEKYGLTTQDEIGRNAPKDPEEKKQLIQQRMTEIEQGDPANPLEALRTKRAAEKAGITTFKVMWVQSGHGQYVMNGVTGEGEVKPILKLEVMDDLSDAPTKYYFDWALKRLRYKGA